MIVFAFVIGLKHYLTKRFMMVGGTWTETKKVMPESAKRWLSNKAWCTICELS